MSNKTRDYKKEVEDFHKILKETDVVEAIDLNNMAICLKVQGMVKNGDLDKNLAEQTILEMQNRFTKTFYPEFHRLRNLDN